MPLPLVKPCCGQRDLTVPISAGMGGGEGSSPHLCELGATLLSFPLPLTPPPPLERPSPEPARKEITTHPVPSPVQTHFRIILGLEVSSENGKNRTPSGAVLKLVVFRFSLASPID